MDFASVPIVDFYKHCLAGAQNKGFKWVVSLLARDVDRGGLYENLHRAWLSLDSITGEQFLFIIAGKENCTNEERWNSKVNNITNYEHSAIYNEYTLILNNNVELADSAYCNCRRCREANGERYKARMHENQTAAVNSLMKFFLISEREIPCLVFTSLYNKSRYIVPIHDQANNIYGYFKNLFNQIAPRLCIIKELDNRRKELLQKQTSISAKIRGITFARNETIYALYEELSQLAKATNNTELLDCITNRVYAKCEQPLRAKVDKFIDLIKNYEKDKAITFDPTMYSESFRGKIEERNVLEKELAVVMVKLSEIDGHTRYYAEEVETIIARSEMKEKTIDKSRAAFMVTGNNNQINAAFDEATISASQVNYGIYNDVESIIAEIREDIENYKLDKEQKTDLIETVDEVEKADKAKNKSKLKRLLFGIGGILKDFAVGAAAGILANKI